MSADIAVLKRFRVDTSATYVKCIAIDCFINNVVLLVNQALNQSKQNHFNIIIINMLTRGSENNFQLELPFYGKETQHFLVREKQNWLIRLSNVSNQLEMIRFPHIQWLPICKCDYLFSFLSRSIFSMHFNP